MGVRLYPEGCTPELMEVLAHVPAGTWARLAIHEAKYPPYTDDEAMDDWYETLLADHDINVLYTFKHFGYGKLNGMAYTLVKAMDGDENAGYTEDSDRVRALLKVQGTVSEDDMKLITAVSWS
jgi:hypothetical protein